MPQQETNTRLERRSVPVRDLRAKKNDDGGQRIAGYAAVFDSVTDIGGWFREVIKPGAFARAIDEHQDVRALINHDPNLIIGRTDANTLTLEETDHGLWFEVDLPDTQSARDLAVSIERGDVSQCSFAFIATDERWVERKDEPSLREVNDVDLFDVSAVTYPAYDATSVGLRSAETIYEEHIQSLDGQDDESDDGKRSDGQDDDDPQAVVDLIRSEI